MESDDLTPRIPRKRSRSPSTLSISSLGGSGGPGKHTTPSSAAPSEKNENARPPAPKRLRRSHDVPAYDAPVDEHARRHMAGANPLGRKVLKKEAKKRSKGHKHSEDRPDSERILDTIAG